MAGDYSISLKYYLVWALLETLVIESLYVANGDVARVSPVPNFEIDKRPLQSKVNLASRHSCCDEFATYITK